MNYDILCFSHLRWDFVYQRPQQLMNRLAARHRIFFFEEPIFEAGTNRSWFEVTQDPLTQVNVFVPHLPAGSNEEQIANNQAAMLKHVLRDYAIDNFVSWYYSPMALGFSDQLHPVYTVYDCMDELSAFLFAPAALKQYERALLKKADIVFTGGRSLYLAKKELHKNIHAFPSSIDKDHFHTARTVLTEPEDQRSIPHPRIGFYGVIDERLDLVLIDKVSTARPDWQLVFLGPIVKVDPASLPRRSNIHYLGQKKYEELPAYLSSWDIAMMPFALNASTKFISPTKTPEYLAGGKPVIAPSIADVITPYGEEGLVAIADTAGSFTAIAERMLARGLSPQWLKKVDHFLAGRSWEKTVNEMEALIEKGTEKTAFSSLQKENTYV